MIESYFKLNYVSPASKDNIKILMFSILECDNWKQGLYMT